MIQRRNRLFERIGKISNHKELIEVDKELKALETEAIYRVVTDAYKERFKIRTWIFNKIFSHMLEKMQEEPTIYYLMQKVQEHRTMSK